MIDNEESVAAVRRLRTLLAAARAMDADRVSCAASPVEDGSAVEGSAAAASDGSTST